MNRISLLLLSLYLAGCSGSYVRSTYSKNAPAKDSYVLGIASENTLSDAIGNELLRYGFTIVERSRIQAVLEELKLSASGVLLPNNLKQVGNILSVDALVFTTVQSDASNPNTVGSASIKVVDVESGQLLAGVNYQNRNFSKIEPGVVSKREPLPKTARKIAKSISKAFKKIRKATKKP